MEHSITLLEQALSRAESTARHQRYMEASFRKNAKPGGTLAEIADMHARDAATAEVLVADYTAALEKLRS